MAIKSENNSPIKIFFDDIINTIDENRNVIKESKDYYKMVYLTKGNVLLRKSQFPVNFFVLLEHAFENQENDFQKLMLWQNLYHFARA